MAIIVAGTVAKKSEPVTLISLARGSVSSLFDSADVATIKTIPSRNSHIENDLVSFSAKIPYERILTPAKYSPIPNPCIRSNHSLSDNLYPLIFIERSLP